MEQIWLLIFSDPDMREFSQPECPFTKIFTKFNRLSDKGVVYNNALDNRGLSNKQIVAGQFLFSFCKEMSHEGLVNTKNHVAQHAYLIGSKWAITLDQPLLSVHSTVLTLNIEKEQYQIEGMKMNNDLLTMNKTSVNLALLKVKLMNKKINYYCCKLSKNGFQRVPYFSIKEPQLNRSAGKHGTVFLCPHYPEEGLALFTADDQQYPTYQTTAYNLCHQYFGYVVGVFCTLNVTEGRQNLGKGVFYDGMLVGLTTGIATEGVQLVTAIAPALRWITDTMSEIIHR